MLESDCFPTSAPTEKFVLTRCFGGPKLDAEVCRRPEGVPADRDVPGNIPGETNSGACDGDRRAPYIPRERSVPLLTSPVPEFSFDLNQTYRGAVHYTLTG